MKDKNNLHINNTLNFVRRHKVLIENFSYMSLLQVFLMIAPLITYPYLVRVLGLDLYGVVITAQVLASYASIVIDFGSNSVCAKHVSVNRNDKSKLSEIVSSVLCVRFILWIFCFFVYAIVVALVPSYRNHWLLFLLTYGFTTNELLFPQYFFQGIEKMKYITGVNIVFKLVFIILVFIVVTSKEDYLYVPVLYTLGYYLGGIYALYVIIGKMHIKLYIPNKQQMWIYIKDSAPIFGTDLICTIKDKFNYLLLGMFSGMGNVVIYDLGMKIYTIVAKPSSIVGTVMFPRSAKTRSTQEFNKVLRIIVFMNIGLIITVNVFLPWISAFFLNKQIDLLPLRLFTLAPLFSCTSAFIISNFCIARGYNKYVLYSIIFTTFAYLITLGLMYIMGFLHNLYSFVLLALISYMAEFAYRIYVYFKIKKIEND